MNGVSEQHVGTHNALKQQQKFQPISSIAANEGSHAAGELNACVR
jgi:hypothetical protein